jgi:hypothetical protein
MSNSSTVDPAGKTPLYRLAIKALQTGVFHKFRSDNPPAGWFYTYPGIGSYFQLPEISTKEHVLDDLYDARKVPQEHTKNFGRLCTKLQSSNMNYQQARRYIITTDVEQEFKIWADAVEGLWHGVDFTKEFHNSILHDIGLCFPTLLNRYFPIDHPDPLNARLFAAREWDELSRLDEDEISKLCELWVVESSGMIPPAEWVQESYQYYWALAKAQYVEDIQELDDIQLAIIRVYLSHSVNHLNNQTELSNPEVPPAGTIPAPYPDPNPNPRFNRRVLKLLKKEVVELEQDLEHDAWALLGRQAEAVPSTSVPSLPEHLHQVRRGSFLSLRGKSSQAIANYSFERSLDSTRQRFQGTIVNPGGMVQ